MAHIPMDDIQELWNQTTQHSWSALHQTLEQHKGKAAGISDTLVDMMLPITQRESQAGHNYPDSPQQLAEVLNRQLPK